MLVGGPMQAPGGGQHHHRHLPLLPASPFSGLGGQAFVGLPGHIFFGFCRRQTLFFDAPMGDGLHEAVLGFGGGRHGLEATTTAYSLRLARMIWWMRVRVSPASRARVAWGSPP